MADPFALPPSTRINDLKLELKTWEHTFASTHSGAKPTTEDIKADLLIASKYKEYYKLQKPPKPPKPARPTPRSSKPPDDPFAPPPLRNPDPFARPPVTPKSTRRTLPPPSYSTPTKTPPYADIYESPLSIRRARLFGNRLTADSVGPTPQKSGQILGLFDNLACN